jgi:hypothetical protein
MPVSPQDFALWSDLTGNPYPQTPAERMAIAPEVYNFTRNIGRRGTQPMGGFRKAVDVIGKAALAAGALAGAAYLLKGDDNTPPPPSPTTASSAAAPSPAFAEPIQEVTVRVEKPSANISSKEFLSGFTPKGLLTPSLVLDDEPGVPPYQTQSANPLGQTAAASADITPPTTSDRYGQDIVPHQTQTVQEMRGVSPAKPTVVDSEEKPATQSHVITSSQTFSPGSEVEQLSKAGVPHTPVRDRADELISEFLGMVKGEERQQGQIQKGLDVYAAGVAGRGEKVLKQVLKEGRQEGISPVGTGTARAAEGFRQTPQYAEMMRSAGVEIGPEEVIYSSRQPAVFTEVRPSPETRLTGAEPQSVESPIAAMSAAVTQEPQEKVTVSVQKPATTSPLEGVDPATIELARKALGHLPLEEAVAKLTQQKQSLIETVPTGASRVAKEGRITPNEFLSAMSQQKGPLAAYPISPERSKAVSNLTFYPGGEMGVTMKSGGRPQEFAYATADPYRLSMRDYAEEGYPETMGNIGSIAAGQGIAHQMGLQNRVERGGMISEKRKPAYAGLMSDAEIVSAGIGKPSKTRDRAMEIAQRHFETKQILNAFANKYPQPPMSPEEISRLREERSAVRRAGLS